MRLLRRDRVSVNNFYFLYFQTRDTTLDYMHFLCKGLARQMIELTFKVPGSIKERSLKYCRISTQELDKILKGIRYPSALGRRSRPLDVANWKAAEFRNVLLFAFSAVLRAIEFATDSGTIPTRHLWAQLAFLSRAYTLPEVSYN